MSRLLYTVENLVNEVRSLTDEVNVDSLDTDDDILPSLNRAQDFAFDIYARKYPEPILTYSTLELSDGVQEYDIPENVFEDRIQKLEVSIPSGSLARQESLERISYRDLSNYEASGKVDIPYYYAILSRTIRIVPAPTGSYDIRMWYLRNCEKLVLPQGRITTINTGSNYVILDSTGSGLDTESDQFESYVNFIDGQTGEIKGSAQIQSITENRITFRTTPTRSTVLNRTISGSLPSDLEKDDYICAIDGSCVPYYGKPTCNFLVQYAVAEMSGKLGGERNQEEQILQKFEQQIERSWVGRERQMRVQNRSSKWRRPVGGWFFRG